VVANVKSTPLVTISGFSLRTACFPCEVVAILVDTVNEARECT
jgi:hypothetical protein